MPIPPDPATSFPLYTPTPHLPPDLQLAERRFYEQLAADPEAAVAAYRRRFGNLIDRDNVRELFPEYAASRESRQALSAATYVPAGLLADRMYEQEVVKPDPTGGNVVAFNAGGPGTGKTTASTGHPLDAQIVMDGTLSNYERSRPQVQRALDNGKQVVITHVQRPFEEALGNIIHRATRPDNGRVVTLRRAAQGRIGAHASVLRFADEYADHPNFRAQAIDNTRNQRRIISIDELRQQAPENLDDLIARGKDYINVYFRDNAANNPALTEALRRRILGTDAGSEGGPDSGADDRQPGASGPGGGGTQGSSGEGQPAQPAIGETPRAPDAIPTAPPGWQNRAPDGPWHPPELTAPLAPLLADFTYRDALETCVPALPGWRVLAGTRRGRLHAHHGTHREDAFFHGGDTENGRFWIFCVCDGAGSSRLSRVGAEVTGRRLVDELSRVFRAQADAWAALSIDALKPALEAAIIDAVREDAAFLATLAAESGREPKDFRCTLLLTVLYRHADTELACLSQVGDGFLAGLNRQGVARRYGPAAAPGGYSGEVDCFVPDEGCVAQARPFGIMDSTANLQALLLCTDGIEDPFYPVETHIGALFGQFTRGTPESVAPGLTWPDPLPALIDPDPEMAKQRLAAWLAFEKRGENDDRTVLLIYRDPKLS